VILASEKTSLLLSAEEMGRALEKMAQQIVDRWLDAPVVAFVGVHKRGVPFAQRLAVLVQQRGKQVEFGKIDITPYRDDLQTMPIVMAMEGSELPFDVDDAVIILCDEVIYTGRTTRAALDELLDYGRPRCVQFAALVDRAGRELPIQPDYSALQVHVDHSQRVRVHFTETDGLDEVFICARDS
jgi:pyrimidine operon attenuation protein / uracil phosphoribosyltransferase